MAIILPSPTVLLSTYVTLPIKRPLGSKIAVASSIVYPSTLNATTATKTAPKATTTKGRIQYEHSYYEGDLVDGIQHGKGVYVWDDGTRYEGDFFEGNITKVIV